MEVTSQIITFDCFFSLLVAIGNHLHHMHIHIHYMLKKTPRKRYQGKDKERNTRIRGEKTSHHCQIAHTPCMHSKMRRDDTDFPIIY